MKRLIVDYRFFAKGFVVAIIVMAAATVSRFLIIYCPSRVGTKADCQVAEGRKNRGRIVVNICRNKRAMARRFSLGKRNSTPISISKRPKSIKNTGNRPRRLGNMLAKSS